MQGKCNLLNPLDCKTGSFYMFSQYAQDLTKAYTMQDSYRCVPSKYVAFDLNTKSRSGVEIGEMFQNYFENACTVIRAEKTTNFDPSSTLWLLFSTLEKWNLIKTTQDATTSTYHSDNIKYIGDINIYSYNPTQDGIGYSEIYCYIPNDAQSTSYDMTMRGENSNDKSESSSIYKFYNIDDERYIRGYEGDDDTYSGLKWKLDGDTGLSYYDIMDVNSGRLKGYWNRGIIPAALDWSEGSTDETRSQYTTREEEKESFQFNAVLVLYDIVNKGETSDSTTIHNVPLGIWFSGVPQDESLTNTITKFTNNEDIYNQGTSYGLRICSRFLCAPNLTKFEDTTVSSTNDNEELTTLLSAMAENVELFNSLSKEVSDMNTTITDHMINFRSNKTNVPYLRLVNGSYYWFVNGKNTGVCVESVAKETINNLIVRVGDLEVSIVDTVTKVLNEKLEKGIVPSITNEELTTIIAAFEKILLK